MSHKQFGKGGFVMEHADHGRFRQPDDKALAHGGGGRDAERLTGQARFAEEIGRRIDPDHRFFALTGDDGQLDPPGLHIKHGIGGIALGEDHLSAGVTGGRSASASLGEKGYRIELPTLPPFYPTRAPKNYPPGSPTKSMMSSLVQRDRGFQQRPPPHPLNFELGLVRPAL